MDRSVTIAGMGYVGLTMAACLAERGVKTVGIDVDRNRLALLSKGETTIYEPHLKDMIRKNLVSGNLSFIEDYKVLQESNVTFITVGTPSKTDDSIDLEQVRIASESIGKELKTKRDYHLVVVRSTVVPGTSENMIKELISQNSGKTCSKDFGLCMNPEFLREGSAVQDMMKPDRIIMGESDKKAGSMLEEFYNKIYSTHMPKVFRTSLETAEMIKYVNNAFLATKISFINSIAHLCERTPRTDINIVAEGLGLDPRISPSFLRAGLGWGGSCFPKDLRSFLTFAQSQNIELPVISAAMKVNDIQPILAVEKAKEFLNDLKEKCIAILGLAFKPNTDDVREAVSLKIINKLLDEGAYVRAYDPAAIENSKKMFGDQVFFAKSAQECIKGSDCCIIVTEWDEFKTLHPDDFRKNMRRPFVIDGRRIYEPKEFSDNMEYYGIGIGKD
ncbi:UDP-glucose dehydrogenase family protein [Thermoproteota archaeon]